MLELLGYAASVLTAVSLMMGNIWKLRWFNLAGSGLLAFYAVLVHAWPVAAVNVFIVGVDAYYIWELRSRRDLFGLMEVSAQDTTFLKGFLTMYGDDIQKFFPGFALEKSADPQCVFIMRNLTPVGLFIYEDEGRGTARILLDYATPPYRDLANARFLYNKGCAAFLKAGFREFVLRSPSPRHAEYMRRVGFAQSAVDDSAWVKTLASGRDLAALAA